MFKEQTNDINTASNIQICSLEIFYSVSCRTQVTLRVYAQVWTVIKPATISLTQTFKRYLRS